MAYPAVGIIDTSNTRIFRQARENIWYRYIQLWLELSDSNRITIEGSTEIAFTEDVGKRMKS